MSKSQFPDDGQSPSMATPDDVAAQNHVNLIQTTYFQHPNHRQRAPAAVQATRKLTRPSYPAAGDANPPQKLIVEIVSADTFGAARTLHQEYPNDKIAVLNHANAFQPGGGFLGGAHAQEEDLCHCSTLHATLNPDYYPINPDQLIYSPDVLVVKSKAGRSVQGRLLPEDQWYYVDVITSAAMRLPPTLNDPNSGLNRYRFDADRQTMRDKIVWIVSAAVAKGVKRLVLGAFGCGQFGHPADEVALLMKDILVGRDDLRPPHTDWGTRGLLHVVIAIYDPVARHPTLNAFRRVWRESDIHDDGTFPQPLKLQYVTFPPGYVGVDYTVPVDNPADADTTHNHTADSDTTVDGQPTNGQPANGQTNGGQGDDTILLQNNLLSTAPPDDSFANDTLFG